LLEHQRTPNAGFPGRASACNSQGIQTLGLHPLNRERRQPGAAPKDAGKIRSPLSLSHRRGGGRKNTPHAERSHAVETHGHHGQGHAPLVPGQVAADPAPEPYGDPPSPAQPHPSCPAPRPRHAGQRTRVRAPGQRSGGRSLPSPLARTQLSERAWWRGSADSPSRRETVASGRARADRTKRPLGATSSPFYSLKLPGSGGTA
jgi:hypothetical protein